MNLILYVKAKKGTSRKRRRVLNAEGRAELDRKAAEEKNKFIENVRHSFLKVLCYFQTSFSRF